MTTYNTGNPIGSTDARDLYDNAQNLDTAVNSTADTFTDRLGVVRPTLKSATDPSGLVQTAVNAMIAAEAASDVLRNDLSDASTPGKGSALVGFKQPSFSAPVAVTLQDYLCGLALETDRLVLLRSECARGRTYIKKGPLSTGGPNSKFNVGMNMNGYNTAEWAFESDADDFWRVRYGFVGAIRASTTYVNATNLSAEASTSGDNRWYSANTQLNATFDVVFTGTGLIFNHYVDNRGGRWSISIDGGEAIVISTHSDNPENAAAVYSNISKVLAVGLSSGSHTAVFTFIGDDPSYPPSGGVSRGWFKFENGIEPDAYTATVITGNEMALGSSPTLCAIGILECPISATPTGSGLTASWVPAHGSSTGAIVVTQRKMYIDGNEVPASLSHIGTDEVAFTEWVMTQNITAYNTNDTGKTLPMWSGVFTHKLNRDGLTMALRIKTLRDITVSDGYSADLSTKISTFGVAEFDNGYSKDCAIPGDGTVSTNVGQARSAVFYSRSASHAFAVSVNSAISAQSLKSSFGANPSHGLLLTERSDDVQKVYWRLFNEGAVVPSGTEIRHEHIYFLAANYKYGL